MQSYIDDFNQKLKAFYSFHLLFLALLAAELLVLVILLPFLARSGFVALTIAALLVTLFGYFSLRSYRESVLRDQIKQIVDGYGSRLSQELSSNTTLDVKKSELANGFFSFADHLPIQATFTIPYLPKPLEDRFFNWVNLGPQTFKEEIIKRALICSLESLKLKPSDPNKHADLATGYLKLSHFYKLLDDLVKAKETLIKTVEALKVLNDLRPNDLEVLDALCEVYKELNETDAEISALEKSLLISPSRPDALLRLGQLYFSSGKHALGFKTYETLKSLDLKRSDELLKSIQI